MVHCRILFKTVLFDCTIRHDCSPIDLLHIFRTHLPKITSWWLLLKIGSQKVFENPQKNDLIRIVPCRGPAITLKLNPANIYLFLVSNRSTKKVKNMFEVKICSCVSVVDFEQVNVSWELCHGFFPVIFPKFSKTWELLFWYNCWFWHFDISLFQGCYRSNEGSLILGRHSSWRYLPDHY